MKKPILNLLVRGFLGLFTLYMALSGGDWFWWVLFAANALLAISWLVLTISLARR